MTPDRREAQALSAGSWSEETPIPFSVRVSNRARHVRLTVTARDGLVVVVPPTWRGDPQAVVASKRAWATRALARVAERRAALTAGPEALLPRAVELPALGVVHPVRVHDGRRASARVVDGVLEVGGADADARLRALGAWLDRTGRAALPLRVHALAEATGLRPARVRVTRARSRWGSCSARGTVSLSRSALFLTPELLDALILHELAHLRELNHSTRFWRALAALDPSWSVHRAQLRTAHDRVPAWADA